MNEQGTYGRGRGGDEEKPQDTEDVKDAEEVQEEGYECLIYQRRSEPADEVNKDKDEENVDKQVEDNTAEVEEDVDKEDYLNRLNNPEEMKIEEQPFGVKDNVGASSDMQMNDLNEEQEDKSSAPKDFQGEMAQASNIQGQQEDSKVNLIWRLTFRSRRLKTIRSSKRKWTSIPTEAKAILRRSGKRGST